jgi:hypothetical protein
MENNKKINSSAGLGFNNNFMYGSNIGLSPLGDGGGAFFHSYKRGPNSGYHAPGTEGRPYFGVNSDNYFAGDQTFPSPIQFVSKDYLDQTHLTYSKGEKDNLPAGFGWANKTLYPIIKSPFELDNPADIYSFKKRLNKIKKIKEKF